MVGHDLTAVTVFCSGSQIHITEPSLIHSFLDSQVKHCLFFTIVNTCHTRHIRLFVIGTHLVNDIHRQVLHGNIRIVGKEFLTVYHNFLDFLSIDGNRSVFIDFRTRQLLHQFFQCRTFRYTIGGTVIYQCILGSSHFRSLSNDLHSFQ